METNMKEMKALINKTNDWVREKYIPHFESNEEMVNNALEVAAVMNMNDCLTNYLEDIIYQVENSLLDKEDYEATFEGITSQQFYDYFEKYNHTLADVYSSWVSAPELNSDLLGLQGWGAQFEAICEEIKHYFIDNNLEKEDKEND